jgi:ATP-binding cassette subfamily B protein
MIARAEQIAKAPGLFRRLLRYARPYLKPMLAALVMILGTALAINFLPVLIQRGIDNYLDAGEGGLSPAARIDGITRIGFVYLGLAAFGFLLRYAQGLLTAWIGQRIIFDIRRDVFEKALRLPMAFFDRTPVGRLMTRVTSDVEAVQRFVTEGVVGSIADVFMMLGVLGFMLYLNPLLAGTLFAILPVLFVVMTYVNLKLRRANRLIRERQSALNSTLQESLTGMMTIQLFNREREAMDGFSERNRDLRGAHLEEVRWFSAYWPVLEIAQAASVILILAVGGYCILADRAGMTIGVVVAFLSYVRDFFRPLGSLSEKAGTFQQAMAASERIFGLLDREETLVDPEQPVEIDSFRGALGFDGVSFAYEDEHWVLRDVGFSVPEGQSVGIVGATGAGKTTIIALLARFYDVQKGAVLIDGTDVRDFRRRALRRQVGVVQQEPFIFSDTIAANIGLHHPDVDRARIEKAAHYVNAHVFIEKLPQGYDTELMERGGSLSAGEKQLLAMARVFAQNPDILLILDEATANVDTETELLIQDALRKLMRNRTSIVIAHRLSTIRNVDRILVMKEGRLIAQGTHRELLECDPYYRHLYELLSVEAER